MVIHQLKALSDNYNFLIQDHSGKTFAVDPSTADPCLAFLKKHSLNLDGILVTHHHHDHTGGILALKAEYSCTVFAHHSDRDRVPGFSHGLQDLEVLNLGSLNAQVLHIPGHTTGQVAYWFKDHECLFVGDTLFNFGCGRLFEGSLQDMFRSLSRLRTLPGGTKVYCGHEYTLKNLQFFAAVDPENQFWARAHQAAQDELQCKGTTVPFTLEDQIRDNPFLSESFDTFVKWRTLRNAF